MPLPPYYAQNYAGIIGSSLSLSLSFTYYSFQNFLKCLHIILTLLPYQWPIIPMELFKFYSISDNDVIIHTVANIWVHLVWLRQKQLLIILEILHCYFHIHHQFNVWHILLHSAILVSDYASKHSIIPIIILTNFVVSILCRHNRLRPNGYYCQQVYSQLYIHNLK